MFSISWCAYLFNDEQLHVHLQGVLYSTIGKSYNKWNSFAFAVRWFDSRVTWANHGKGAHILIYFSSLRLADHNTDRYFLLWTLCGHIWQSLHISSYDSIFYFYFHDFYYIYFILLTMIRYIKRVWIYEYKSLYMRIILYKREILNRAHYLDSKYKRASWRNWRFLRSL